MSEIGAFGVGVLVVAIYCLVLAVLDFRAKRFRWAAGSLVSALLLTTLPIKTHAVKLDLPMPAAQPSHWTLLPDQTFLDMISDGCRAPRTLLRRQDTEIVMNPGRAEKNESIECILAELRRLNIEPSGFVGNSTRKTP